MNFLTTILTVTSLFEYIEPIKAPEIIEQVTEVTSMPFFVHLFEWITIGSVIFIVSTNLYLRGERKPDSIPNKLTIRHRKRVLFGKTVGHSTLINRLVTLNTLLYNKGHIYRDIPKLKELCMDTVKTIEELLFILEKNGKNEKVATYNFFDIELAHEQYLIQEINDFIKDSRLHGASDTLSNSLNTIKGGIERSIEGYQNIRSKAIQEELKLYKEVKETTRNR